MKNPYLLKQHSIPSIIRLKTPLLLTCIVLLLSHVRIDAQTITSNQIGNQGGYTYEYWKDNGNATMTLGSGGAFSVTWSGINNMLARKGLRPGSKNQTVTYSANYNPSGNSYLCVYGWTTSPLVEYYIVDSWGSWRPPGGTSIGTVNSDGGTYDIYRTQRVNQPSIQGTATFYQYWSVRTSKRTSGTITCANHFNAWASKGMNMGNLYEVSLAVEGYQSSGTANVTSMSMGTGSGGGGSKTIVIRARGVSGSESIQLQINNTTIATWTLKTSMANYTATTSLTGGINVRYTNDASGRDVQVDYIQVNGSTRQAEAQGTNTGVYQNGACGGSNSEWMHCNGYIGFGNTSARVAMPEVNTAEVNEFDEKIRIYPNPSPGGSLTMAFTDKVGEIKVMDFQGKTVKVIHPNDVKSLDLNLNLVPGIYHIQAVDNGKITSKRLIVN